MNILNSNEAFSALMAGKNIMCRAVGELMEFDDLDQFPATVFAMQNYEFCIKIDEISINGYTFLKPYSLEELSEGQDVFLLGNTGSIVKGQFIPEYEELVLAVKNGSVQRDFESAQNQAKAMQSLLGINNDLVLKVVNFQEFMKPEAKPKKTTRKKTESTSEIAQDVVKEPTTESRKGFTIQEVSEIETDPTLIINKFAAQIANCTTTEAVLLLRTVFFANGHLEREHTQHLCKLTEDKLIELDPEQYAPKLTSLDHQIYIDGINSCESEKEIEIILRDLDTQGFSAEQMLEITMAKESKLSELSQPITIVSQEKLTTTEYSLIADDNSPALHPYQSVLDELIERLKIVKTPKEANALYKYTMNWTEEERKPVMDAIHKRLAEFNPPEKSQSSLMVRIQEAKTLIELTKLEDEISECDPQIQERLMSYVSQRRSDLMMKTDIPWEAKN